MQQVKDLMVRKVPMLLADTDLSTAVDKLIQSGYTGLPVVDHLKRLVGFISEQDCIQSLISSSYHCESHIQVADVMSREPLSVDSATSVLDLAQSLGRNRPKIYPVVDEQRRVVGLIARTQIMSELNRSLKSCKVA